MLIILLPSEWFDLIQHGFKQTQGDPLQIVDGKQRSRAIQIQIRQDPDDPTLWQPDPGSPDPFNNQEDHADDEDEGSPKGSDNYEEPDWNDPSITQMAMSAQEANPLVPTPPSWIRSPIPSTRAISPTVSPPSRRSRPSKPLRRSTPTQTHQRRRKRTMKPKLRVSTQGQPLPNPPKELRDLTVLPSLTDRDGSEEDSPGPSPTSDEEEAIAWIRHTPTQDPTWSPEPAITLNEARQMYRMAQLIGSPEVYQNWQRILGVWRDEGRPVAPLLLGLGDEPPAQVPRHLRQMRHQMVTLYHANLAVEKTDIGQELQEMAHRRNLAWLFESYGQAEAKLLEGTAQRPHGITDQAFLKQILFGVVYPQWAQVSQPVTNPLTKKVWKRLGNRLQYGSRWWHLQQQLGEGVFYVLPPQSRRFIERSLTIKRLTFWTEVVRRFNPAGITMGHDLFQAVLGIRKNSCMPVKVLAIERYSLPDLKKLPAIEGPFQVIDEGQRTSGDEQAISSMVPEGFGWDPEVLALLNGTNSDYIE